MPACTVLDHSFLRGVTAACGCVLMTQVYIVYCEHEHKERVVACACHSLEFDAAIEHPDQTKVLCKDCGHDCITRVEMETPDEQTSKIPPPRSAN